MEGDSVAKTIVSLTIGILLIAYVLPVGIEALYGMNFTAWQFTDEGSTDTKTISLAKLLPLFSILCAVILLIIVVLKYI